MYFFDGGKSATYSFRNLLVYIIELFYKFKVLIAAVWFLKWVKVSPLPVKTFHS
jgi:hypothetical protein